MSYQKCPVCGGRGIVPQGFYLYTEGQEFASTSCAPEQCKTCNGSGILVNNDNLNKENLIKKNRWEFLDI